jgi:hypothetical protein
MSAASGAALGAIHGYAVTGGPWGVAIGGAIGLLAGNAGADARYEAAKAQLEAAKKRNEALLAEAARGIGEINRQRTTAFIKTNQALLHYRRQASSESSSLSNQYAAADVIGKSALIAKTAIDQELDQAVSQTLFNNEVQQENLNVAVDNLTNSTLMQYSDPTNEIDALYQGTSGTSELLKIGAVAFDTIGEDLFGKQKKTTTKASGGLSSMLGLFTG